jgi:hypothetical protein
MPVRLQACPLDRAYYTDAKMAAIGYAVMAVTGAVSAQFFI